MRANAARWATTASLAIGISLVAGVSLQCATTECAYPDYTQPECRVIEENDAARLRTSTLVEVRFQDPDAPDARTWDATGLVEETEPGVVLARVAGLGDFALSLERGEEGADAIELILENVAPDAVLSIGPLGEEQDLPTDPVASTRRVLVVDLPSGAPVWVRGRIDCAPRYRIAVTADIQTNPRQFERIVERLQEEALEARAAGEPMMGLILNGDLTEVSRHDEFEIVRTILSRLPFPTAVTPGNHDVFRRLHPVYNRMFGPGNHAFSVCTSRVVMLDTGSGTIARSIEGRLPELLDRRGADFLIAGMHHPPHAGLTAAGWSSEAQAQHLLMELAIVNADLVLAGHYHALRHFDDIRVGGRTLRQVIVGTGGAHQTVGAPRYGYLRLTFGESLEACFVEVPPAGYASPTAGTVDGIAYCSD
jgi:hypothetical protein